MHEPVPQTKCWHCQHLLFGIVNDGLHLFRMHRPEHVAAVKLECGRQLEAAALSCSQTTSRRNCTREQTRTHGLTTNPVKHSYLEREDFLKDSHFAVQQSGQLPSELSTGIPTPQQFPAARDCGPGKTGVTDSCSPVCGPWTPSFGSTYLTHPGNTRNGGLV